MNNGKHGQGTHCTKMGADSLVENTGKYLSEALLFAEHGENLLCTKNVLNVRNNFCTQHFLPRFELGIFMYWTCNSMNNLSSYCGLVDAKIRASGNHLPVKIVIFFMHNKIGLKCKWPISKSGCKKPTFLTKTKLWSIKISWTLLSLLIYDASEKIILPV